MTNHKSIRSKFLIPACLIFALFSCADKAGFSVKGTVTGKEQGKDGYTAIISATDGRQYNAVISRVNMSETNTYQDLSIGDQVKLYGDTINLGATVSITVRKIEK